MKMLTENGINYICQSFGDVNFCCVKDGLSWFYTVGGLPYTEVGGTAQIVSRLASGLITDLTMTSPNRGTFTKDELDFANGAPVTLQDAQQIANHDEPAEGQYCYGVEPPTTCKDYFTEVECTVGGCYWYNDKCNTQPQTPVVQPPWMLIAAAAGAIIIIAGVIIYKKKR